VNTNNSANNSRSDMVKLPIILIVDDDDDTRYLISRVLSDEGYRVVEARGGSEAVQLALEQTPDLILMDIAMPRVDGLSTVWELRGRPGLANVPIVIMSGYDTYDLRAESAAAGCGDYLEKPLDIDKLRAIVRNSLRL
jgi:CheY-like chemotaxis protein